MNLNYLTQKRIVFLTLNLIALFYIVFFTVFAYRTFDNFPTELLFIRNYQAFKEICSTGDFYKQAFTLAIFVFLTLNLLIALIKFIRKYYLTQAFVASLNKKSAKNYIIIDSKNSEVFTYGFLKPKIYIATDLLSKLSQREISKIINHEKLHQRYLDPLQIALAELIIGIIPPIPFKYKLLEKFYVLSEIVADNFDFEDKDSKSQTLKLIAKFMGSRLTQGQLCGFNFQSERIGILTGSVILDIRGIFLRFSAFCFIFFYIAMVAANANGFISECKIEVLQSIEVKDTNSCVDLVENPGVKYCRSDEVVSLLSSSHV